MPSPFPGMDPYLEGPMWMPVHTEFTVEVARQLMPLLRPKYLAIPSKRFVLEEEIESVAVTTQIAIPDVGVVETGKELFELATATLSAPLQMATVIPTLLPHITVEIRDAQERQLVTAIEVLSPANKRGAGRNEYLGKRRQILISTTHLLEIDLQREGARVPMQKPLPPADYFVFLSRAERRPLTEIWPIDVQDHLPIVPVPLLEGDPDVSLDLQRVLSAIYDTFGYELLVDYSQPPHVPLAAKKAAWADDLLRAKGLRS